MRKVLETVEVRGARHTWCLWLFAAVSGKRVGRARRVDLNVPLPYRFLRRARHRLSKMRPTAVRMSEMPGRKHIIHLYTANR